eukprot:g3222.t1
MRHRDCNNNAECSAITDDNTHVTKYNLRHYRVTLPSVHGYKRGGLTEGYDEDTVQVKTLFQHLAYKIVKHGLITFDYSKKIELRELQVGESLTVKNNNEHGEKHLYVKDITAPGVVITATKFIYNNDLNVHYNHKYATKYDYNNSSFFRTNNNQPTHGEKKIEEEVSVMVDNLNAPYQTFLRAALRMRSELDFKTAGFALNKAIAIGGEVAMQKVNEIRLQMKNFKKHFKKVEKAFNNIKEFLSEIVFDDGFFEDLMFNAIRFNKNGNMKKFYKQVENVYKYFTLTATESGMKAKKKAKRRRANDRKDKKTQQLLSKPMFCVLLYTANMFEELIKLWKTYNLLRYDFSDGQRYTDLGVAYDSIGKFDIGARYHEKAYKVHLNNPKVSQSTLNRYSKSITSYARYYFYAKDMRKHTVKTINDNQIPGTNIIDQAASLKLYNINNTGFKVSSDEDILGMENSFKHLKIYENNHHF